MSRYHCSCGFAINDPDEFGDHYHLVFASKDDIGTDGRVHAELADDHVHATGRYPDTVPLPRHVCACGFATDDTPEFDDHLLIAFLIRPINPANLPSAEDMGKITAAIRTLASLGLIAARGSDIPTGRT